MASTSRFSYTDLQNPIFIHLSDGPLMSVTKLSGTGDYRTWKRSIEIQLIAKRKFCFVDGNIKGSTKYFIEAS